MSIPVSHLRIGNYIFNGLYPEKVTSDTLWSMAKTGSEAYGVELTPEILEKAGFFYDGYVYNKKNLFSCPTFSPRGEEWVIYIGEFGAGIETPVKYLHELQNLIHSLTGQELQINL